MLLILSMYLKNADRQNSTHNDRIRFARRYIAKSVFAYKEPSSLSATGIADRKSA